MKHRSHFFPYALGPKDGFSPIDDPKMYTLRTLMERNGHNFIDVLKVDIEGNEYDSLEVFIDSFHGEPLPFGQLQLEVHVYGGSEWQDFPKFLKWWEKLEEAGLRPFFSEPNLVYVNLVRGVQPGLIEVLYFAIMLDGDGITEILKTVFLHQHTRKPRIGLQPSFTTPSYLTVTTLNCT